MIDSRPEAARVAKLLLCVVLVVALAGCRADGSRPSVSARSVAAGASAGADVILVTLDTFRHDAPGFAGNTAARTPVLDRLAAQGLVFQHARAHNVVTLPSHANILTGRLPPDHGVRENSGYVLPASVPTWAGMLRAAGYRTAGFVAAFPLDSRFGLNRDFEVYDDSYPLGARPDQFRMAERRGDEVISRALEWWSDAAATSGPGGPGGPGAPGASRAPRFLWVHLYDPHAPYLPPPPFARDFADDPYHGEIAATDSFLAPLLGPLLDQGAQTANTLVVVTADHGEALGDHGELTHGIFAYEATVRVPLVLWGPGIPPGTDSRQAGHVDVLPTVAMALGLRAPAGLAGSSLLEPLAAPAAPLYFEALSTHLNRGWAPLRGLVDGRWKMIELPLPELYDLEADPREERNLVEQERRVFRELAQRFPEKTWPPRRTGALDAEEVSNLRALGYMVGEAPSGATAGIDDDPKRLIDFDRRLQEVVRAYGEGRLEDAVRLGRAAIAERPSGPDAYETTALALRQLERHDEAIVLLRAGLAAGAGRTSMQRDLGQALTETGRPTEAIDVLAPLRDSEDASAVNALAVALTDAGRHGEAESLLREQVARTPTDPKTRENLGIVLLRRGATEAAVTELELALARTPDLPIAWNTLGVARYRMGNPAGAIEAWGRAASSDPRLHDAWFNRGLVALELRRFDETRVALTRFLETAPPGRSEDRRRARAILASLPR